MNGVHDCGGMDGLGPIRRVSNEPVFAHDWERRTFALMLVANANSYWNIDESRHFIERLDAVHYLQSTYYEHWIHSMEAMLIEKGVITQQEVDAKIAAFSAKQGTQQCR